MTDVTNPFRALAIAAVATITPESDKVGIGNVDRILITTVVHHNALSFDEAAELIARRIGVVTARSLELETAGIANPAIFRAVAEAGMLRAQDQLQSFSIIGATGLYPTAEVEFCAAFDAETIRLRGASNYLGGHA